MLGGSHLCNPKSAIASVSWKQWDGDTFSVRIWGLGTKQSFCSRREARRLRSRWPGKAESHALRGGWVRPEATSHGPGPRALPSRWRARNRTHTWKIAPLGDCAARWCGKMGCCPVEGCVM